MSARFPQWIRRKWSSGTQFESTRQVLQDLRLHTVCKSARCPNQGECWNRHTATFLILGNTCTRHCRFCAVPAGIPNDVDSTEPQRVAEAVRRLGIRHAVITSVTRDDLRDGGAGEFVHTVMAVRAMNPATAVEVLVPDFMGKDEYIRTVVEGAPDVFGHNIETVRRLFPLIRDVRADYDRSLQVLQMSSSCVTTKSGFMVGHGETETEVKETLEDLYEAGCRAVTIGQYLRPSPEALPVAEYLRPEQFGFYKRMAETIGFNHVMAGPFVRSSYHAEELQNARTTHV